MEIGIEKLFITSDTELQMFNNKRVEIISVIDKADATHDAEVLPMYKLNIVKDDKNIEAFADELQEATEIKIAVKAVKFMPGHDGDSMSCSLYINGKKTAVVFDDSWGGEYSYSVENKDLFEIFESYVKELPPYNLKDVFNTDEDKYINQGPDTVINDLVKQYEYDKNERAMVKKATTNTLFRLHDKEYGPHDYSYIEAPYSEFTVGHITKKYGKNVSIYNVFGKWPEINSKKAEKQTTK